MKGGAMKCLTVNVHAWLEDNQEEKVVCLAQAIAEQDYDLVALQEVNQTIEAAVVYDDVKQDNYGLILLEKLRELGRKDYAYYWTNSHIGYSKYDEGLAFLTKLPVKATDAFYCSRSTSPQSILSRKVLGLTLDWKGQEIDCYSCHINLPGCQEEDQLENVQSILSRKSSQNLKLLLGDFNTDALSQPADYQAIKNLGLYDSFELAETKDEGITVLKNIDGWQEHSQEKRLDYLFLSQERRVLSSRVIFNGQNKPIISDHFGLSVELIV